MYLWGALKDTVYAKPIVSSEHLVERIMEASAELKRNPANLNVNNIVKLHTCVENSGGHFEQLLQ